MKTTLALAAAVILVMGACAPQSDMGGVNPLLIDRTTPFGVPPFNEIREEHLKPAFESAMAAHIEEITAIVENTDAPTFANTIEAFDRSGQLVDQVHLLFLNANMANTTPGLQALAKEINPMWTGHQDDLMLNQKLFEQVNGVYLERENLDLTIEESRLVFYL
jgi:peptidyl-dipeptidase Dcp